MSGKSSPHEPEFARISAAVEEKLAPSGKSAAVVAAAVGAAGIELGAVRRTGLLEDTAVAGQDT